MRVIVIGAGIGGLTFAIAARRLGLEVVVCERAPALTEVGAGISLWANAMRGLDAIGVAERVRVRAMRGTYSQFRDWRGRVLMTVDLTEMERRKHLPVTVWMIHRAELIAALGEHVPEACLRLGKTCAEVDERDRQVTVKFSDGSEETGDLIVGADGLRSVVRAREFENSSPRYAGYTCWRGVTEVPESVWPSGHIVEVWGRGARFGITSLPGGRVYWYGAVNAAEGMSDDAARGMLEHVFGEWAAPVQEVIAATPESRRIRNDIYDRPPLPRWYKKAGGVVLLGDAAHPTTPNLGQGGCMAIEDGVVLARRLKEFPAEKALAKFQEDRFARTTMITTRSRRLGIMGHWENPVACFARDWGTRLTPGWVAFESLVKLTNFDAGSLKP